MSIDETREAAASTHAVKTAQIEWIDPPPVRPSRAAVVEAQLRARPGEWARVDSGPVLLFPWWGRFHQNPEFEVRFVWHKPGQMLGPRDVYVRAIPPTQTPPGGDA